MNLLVLLLVALAGSSWAKQYVEPPIRVDMQPPVEAEEEASRRMTAVGRNTPTIRVTGFMPMPLDHFDPHNPDTFMMRYMFNEEFHQRDGDPIFILVGGEWTIAAGWLVAGNMYEMARENNGYQIYTEHRYYGQTLPFGANHTLENLRFLNVDQALADLAYFITEIKRQPRFAQSKVILYGGSYAGNMVLWFKQRYPHLVVGGVASSGPIKAEVDFTGYLQVVHDSFLSEGGEQCSSIIRQGIADTVAALQTEDGRRNVQEVYRLCDPLNFEDPYSLGYFSGLISWSFSGLVQTAIPGTLISVCDWLQGTVWGVTPMHKVAGFVNWYQGLQTNGCWGMEFQVLVNTYSANTNSRAWYYQTCTEYGYYQTAPRSGTVFDPLTWLSVDFYVEICKQAFTARFDEHFVNNAVDRVNLVFGGLEPEVNNTINIHGSIDPWHYLGVHEHDLQEGSPTITVPRASHCFDMRAWNSADTILMSQAQSRARRLVAEWLST